MFDIYKKLDEEQNREQNTVEPFENVESKHEEEKQSQETSPQESFEKTELDMLSTLDALGGEERVLLAEKSQLLNMEETLKQKIRDEIEVKRHKIENLKYEIPELRQRCEALARVLKIPVQK